MPGRGGGRGRGTRRKKLSPKEPKRRRGGHGGDGGGSGGRSLVAVAAAFAAAVGLAVAAAVRQERALQRRSADVRQSLRSRPLRYSEHAACRMDCRHITRNDVEDALRDGRVNDAKSSPGASPCPRYALDNGRTRCVFAACAQETHVVTVIDVETDHPCGPC